MDEDLSCFRFICCVKIVDQSLEANTMKKEDKHMHFPEGTVLVGSMLNPEWTPEAVPDIDTR